MTFAIPLVKSPMLATCDVVERVKYTFCSLT